MACPSPVGPTHLRQLSISNGCQDHTSIFWYSLKHAETKKTLKTKRFPTTLLQAVSAGFAKSRAGPFSASPAPLVQNPLGAAMDTIIIEPANKRMRNGS